MFQAMYLLGGIMDWLLVIVLIVVVLLVVLAAFGLSYVVVPPHQARAIHSANVMFQKWRKSSEKESKNT